MGGLEILQEGMSLLGVGKKSTESGNGLFGKFMDTIGFGKSPDLAKQATEAKESAEQDRGNIFKEIGRSLLLRQFPRAAVVFDLAKTGKNIQEKGWEGVKEALTSFSSISALLVLIPNELLHHLTDLFAESTIFQKLVEYWPGLDGITLPEFFNKELPGLGKGGSLRDLILREKDPKAVIEAMRIIHQDIFVTGKVSFDMLKDKLGAGGSLAALAGGAGALTLASSAIGNGSGSKEGGSSTAGGLLDQAKDALGLSTGPRPGNKILELAKQHPEAEKTKMQKNLLQLLQDMNVAESAELIRGSWDGNNDEVTVSYVFDNAKYFMIFDNDPTSTDLTVNTSDGKEIYKETDWGGLDSKDDAQTIVKAMRAHPSPSLPPAVPAANDNGQASAAQPKKAA